MKIANIKIALMARIKIIFGKRRLVLYAILGCKIEAQEKNYDVDFRVNINQLSDYGIYCAD